MNKPSRKIIGTGLFALDIILNSKGELITSGLGGSAGNVLAILAQLGWSSAPIAKLGNDEPAQRIYEEFIELNADLRYLRSSESSLTPIIYQHQLENSPEKTHSFSFSCPSCGLKRSPKGSFLAEDEANSVFLSTHADVLYLDRATVFGVELAELYQRTGTLIVFEPSTIGDDHDLFCRALRCAHIVKYADDRLNDLEHFPIGDVAIEICTMGSAGLRYRAPSLDRKWVHLNAMRAPWIVDTSGAGDWCTAGMIYHLFNDGSAFDIKNIEYNRLSRSLRFGQVLSALNCMTLGARGLSKSLPAKKIASTGHYLKNAMLKAEAAQSTTPDPSCLAYELLRGRFSKPNKAQAKKRAHGTICCGSIS